MNQMHVVRVFDQLIYNMHETWELLIDKRGLWMIDHTRPFQRSRIEDSRNLNRCDENCWRLKDLMTTPFLRS
jgi:hypothetical protein